MICNTIIYYIYIHHNRHNISQYVVYLCHTIPDIDGMKALRDLRVPARSGELRLAASRCSRISRLGCWELLGNCSETAGSSNQAILKSAQFWPRSCSHQKYIRSDFPIKVSMARSPGCWKANNTQLQTYCLYQPFKTDQNGDDFRMICDTTVPSRAHRCCSNNCR